MAIGITMCLLAFYTPTEAAIKTAIRSGNLMDGTVWSPTGIPASGDIMIIGSGHTVEANGSLQIQRLEIQSGGRLNISNNHKITITGEISVNGILHVYEGDVACPTPNTPFTIGSQGLVVWEPADKAITGATLFTNGTEAFAPTSTLVINHWHSYSNAPLGSYITGAFGNLTISTLSNAMLFEWDQKNTFATHPVLGTLTIDQGWVVLDKTGQISQHNIGAIKLANANSHLDISAGNHNGNITINTASFENLGGTFNGVLNGSAHFNMHVTGNFKNEGNFRLIFNNGQSSTVAGNASLIVDGDFEHTSGDFRGLFNISTMQSGGVTIETGTATINGGIFMAHYAMHPGNGTIRMKTNGKLTIRGNTANDIFRVGGLTSIGNNTCTISSEWTITGGLDVVGHINSEISSSVSRGPETVTINGKTNLISGKTGFNLGSHPTILRFNGDMEVTGGNNFLCKTAGPLDGVISGNLIISGGTLNVRGSNGGGTMTVNGNLIQNGGETIMFNNLMEAANESVTLSVNGDFTMLNGKIRFNNNPMSTAGHTLQLKGAQATLGGGGNIYTDFYGNNPTFGLIDFARAGVTQLRITDPTFQLQGVRQKISNGTVLELKQGKMLCASNSTLLNDALVIEGTLDVGENRIGSNKKASYSGMMVLSGGRIRLSNTDGLVGTGSSTAIDMQGNFNYMLDANSTVEYYGNKMQTITGTANTSNTSLQYGILEINKSTNSARLEYSNVIIRKRLELTNGLLDLNGFNIQINGGTESCIHTGDGSIVSEELDLNHKGRVIVKQAGQFTTEIPFATNHGIAMFRFEPTGGQGELSVATIGTAANNQPMPSEISSLMIGNETQQGELMTDRWYHVSANGLTAKISIGFNSNEGLNHPDFTNASNEILRWNGSNWQSTGMVEQQQGSAATANQVSSFGYLVAGIDPSKYLAGVLDFEGVLNNNQVELKWTSRPARLVEKFVVERSSDGIRFEPVFDRMAAADSNAITSYQGVDAHPMAGTSYYRVREIGKDGISKFTRKISINQGTVAGTVTINSVYPTTFHNEITVDFESMGNEAVSITLISRDGKKAYQQNAQARFGKNTIQITGVSGLSAGLYFISITNGKSTATQKIIKTNAYL